MTVQFLKQFEAQLGNLRAAFWDVTFDTSYPAGGEVFNRDSFPGRYYKSIAGVQVVGQDADAAGLLISWNHDTKKLQVFYPTGGAEDSPAALAAPGIVDAGSGGDSATFTLTPGVGKEVLATTDLSTVRVRLLVFGF